MSSRAANCVFWPGITSDIQRARTSCRTCDINAPSQQRLPPVPAYVPTLPFESIASDYFQLEGKHYLVTVDRLTNWPDVRQAEPHSNDSGSKGLIRVFRELFATFGVPVQVSTDGGPQYIAKDFGDFLDTWGVHHRLSSSYNPQSNGRAEVSVKSIKRLLRDNIGSDGWLTSSKKGMSVLNGMRDCVIAD